MKKATKNTIKLAIVKIQEAIDLLEKVKDNNDVFGEICDELGYKLADLEFELDKSNSHHSEEGIIIDIKL